MLASLARASRMAAALAAAALAAALPLAASAAEYRVLHEFTVAEGRNPNGSLVQGSDGALYGTADSNVFRLTLDGTLSVLHAFSEDAFDPRAGLTAGGDGYFYGTTSRRQGGVAAGTVFRISADGQFTQLHVFDIHASEGVLPTAELLLASDGQFYGTTVESGAHGIGTVFRISSTGDFAVVHSFDFDDGGFSEGRLAEAADGKLYGTTRAWGLGGNGKGTAFCLTPAGELTVLHDFGPPYHGGTFPKAGLLRGSDGNFYGTTSLGGHGHGTVFRLTPEGEHTVLHKFHKKTRHGSEPNSELIEVNGMFYGVTLHGGRQDRGTVFRIAGDGSPPELLHEFGKLPDGQLPFGALVLASDGRLYGSTLQGGKDGFGTVFSIRPD